MCENFYYYIINKVNYLINNYIKWKWIKLANQNRDCQNG